MLGEKKRKQQDNETWNALEEIPNLSFLSSHMRHRKSIVSQVKDSESKFIKLIFKYNFGEKGVGVSRKGSLGKVETVKCLFQIQGFNLLQSSIEKTKFMKNRKAAYVLSLFNK